MTPPGEQAAGGGVSEPLFAPELYTSPEKPKLTHSSTVFFYILALNYLYFIDISSFK